MRPGHLFGEVFFLKYSPELTAEICKYLSEGSNRTDACTLAGISYETFSQWMNNPDKPEFVAAVKNSETEFKHKNIKIIQVAAKKTWTAAAWLLERKFSDEYAIKNRSEVIHMNFIFDFVGKLAQGLNKILPSFCPHCNHQLDIKQATILEIENLSKNIDFGQATKEAWRGKKVVEKKA